MKLTKKFLSIVLALTMLVCMATTVFAATTPATVTNDAKVTKTWTAASNAQLNDTEAFNFKLTYTGVTAVGSNATATPAGLTENVKNITITGTWKTAAGTGASASFDKTYTELFDGISFSTPGIYTFTLEEVPGSNPNIDYATEKYTITVYVGWETDANGAPTETLKVYYITTANSANEKAAANFPNTAAAAAGLKVTKLVAGNASLGTDEFQFVIKLSGIEGTYLTSDTDVTVTANAAGTDEITVTLSHNESFEIYNLPQTAKYEIIEQVHNYDKTAIGTGAAVTNTKDATFTTGETTLGSGADVVFTNIREITPPTGIFMDVAPYALLIAVALIGSVAMFSRRRREDY